MREPIRARMRYHITTRVDDQTIGFQVPLGDPFVRHTVTIGWPHLLRGLLRREMKVTVIIGGNSEVIDAVLNMNERMDHGTW